MYISLHHTWIEMVILEKNNSTKISQDVDQGNVCFSMLQ